MPDAEFHAGEYVLSYKCKFFTDYFKVDGLNFYIKRVKNEDLEPETDDE